MLRYEERVGQIMMGSKPERDGLSVRWPNTLVLSEYPTAE